MNQPQPPREEPEPACVPKNVLRLMLAIVIALGLVALYANVQKFRRSKIENAVFIPAASPSPTAH